MNTDTIAVFPSRLGWMAVVAAGATVKQLTFGHPTAAEAEAAILASWDDRSTAAPAILNSRQLATAGKDANPLAKLASRLQAYATGTPDDFHDIQIDLGPLTDFQRDVLRQCRRIAYGSTISYAALAAKAGHPRAARAAGHCMAANQIPLIIPCHRVVSSGGKLGKYSAPGGTETKSRLLAMESQILS